MHSEGQHTLERGTLQINSGEILSKTNVFDTRVGFCLFSNPDLPVSVK